MVSYKADRLPGRVTAGSTGPRLNKTWRSPAGRDTNKNSHLFGGFSYRMGSRAHFSDPGCHKVRQYTSARQSQHRCWPFRDKISRRRRSRSNYLPGERYFSLYLKVKEKIRNIFALVSSIYAPCMQEFRLK
jgi:hypothetical protein